jgi:hypothetical protein
VAQSPSISFCRFRPWMDSRRFLGAGFHVLQKLAGSGAGDGVALELELLVFHAKLIEKGLEFVDLLKTHRMLPGPETTG